jgi:Rrf2 family transcriptional regulator, cysteine metabolism repressor
VKVSRTIAYAIHAMLRLGRGAPGVPIPCSQLAQDGRMPERFLLQILRSLVTHGLLHSTRGVEGGYYLARPADEITLRDIVESFDHPLEPSVPALDGLPEPVRQRLLQTLDRVSEAARQELQKLTVAELLSAGDDAQAP